MNAEKNTSAAARTFRVGMLFAAVVTFASCAPASPELPGTAGEPSDVSTLGIELRVDTDGNESGMLARAYADGERMTVVTVGSGSCPSVPEIEGINDDAQTLDVKLSVESGGACTADLAPRTFVLQAPRDLTGYTVRVTQDPSSEG